MVNGEAERPVNRSERAAFFAHVFWPSGARSAPEAKKRGSGEIEIVEDAVQVRTGNEGPEAV